MSLPHFLVLGILIQHGPSSGYDVLCELKKRWIDSWTDVKLGSIYHSLNSLNKKEYLLELRKEQVGGRPEKTIYEITETGHQYFDTLQKHHFTSITPHFNNFALALSFNYKMTAQDIEKHAKAAIQTIDRHIKKLRAYKYEIFPNKAAQKIVDDRTDMMKDERIRLFQCHKKWLKHLIKNITVFDNAILAQHATVEDATLT